MLALYKDLYKNLRVNRVERVTAGEENSGDSKSNKPELYIDVIRNEFRQHSVSDSKYCMQKDEMFFLGNAYLSYVKNTKETLNLYAKYCRGERSTEEAARIVGLALPKRYEGSPKADK